MRYTIEQNTSVYFKAKGLFLKVMHHDNPRAR
jgi:hypothetical protein